jgi:hypothetical protein
MNTLDTLYFPDTVLPIHEQLPLALFFHTIHLLQPVEKDEKGDQGEPSDPGNYPFTEMAFCQEHTPSRLGADRDRFLHLIHDIRTKKDAYVEQLNYLTLASLSAPASRGDNSKQAILSSLLQGMEQQDTDARDEQERLDLWQARLVLKIAEILDQEEEELALQLTGIDDNEIALFKRLQGEIRESGEEEVAEEDPFQELLELKQKMNQPRPGMIRNRLRAWNRLYLSGPLPVKPLLWTTRRQEAAYILLEQYEKESGRAPLSLLQIELPAVFSKENTDVIGEVEQFRTEMQPHLQKMAEALGELAMKENLNVTDPAALLPLAEAWKEAWSSSLESSFPARQYGRAELTIYLLAETYLPALIEKTQGPEMQPPSRHALLAVCG